MIHAELGASTADRWMNCPGSVRLTRDIPNVSTEYTREGTVAHTLLERCIRQGVHPETFLGMELDGIEFSEEMCEAVTVALNLVNALTDRLPLSRLLIETTFELAPLSPPAPMFGTADVVLVAPPVLYVIDYKHGKGYAVPAVNNPQLRYYALGALLSLPAEEQAKIRQVVMTIVQPRGSHPDGIVRNDECSIGELMQFAETLIDRAHEATSPNAELVPGGWCRFCRAQATCPAQKEQAQAIAQIEFEAMPPDEPPAPEALPMPVLLNILEKLPILESWAKAVRDFVQTQLEEGKEVPGYKLVEKRATRKWYSEEQVIKWGREQEGLDDAGLFDQKLKSVAQLEKVVGKGNIPEELISKISSGYNVVPDYDNRPAINMTRGEEFAALPPGDSPHSTAATTRSKKHGN